MKQPIALAALTVLELTPPEQVSVAAQAGYSHVGLRLIPVAGQTLPAFEQRELERRLRDTGIRVLDVEVFRVSPEMPDYEPMLETAQRLGATELLVHGADADEARLVENFGALCELAARYGLHANLEPMPWVEVSTVAKAKRVIERAGKGALLVDPIHFYRADNRIADLAGAPMRYLQFCDAHPGRPADTAELMRQARGDRLFPGEGALDLRALLRATPPELPLSVEVPVAQKLEPLERARRALEATRRVLAAA
ncbi:MAG TPA: TIM barrel protein [Burkholderiales bacterium]|nr:TIM barrel protein [Burkholderiales bacterium]